MPNYDTTCPKCNGYGGTYLDDSLTDKIPCKLCNGTGEKQFKVVKKRNGEYEVVVKTTFSLRTSYFTGTWLACVDCANKLNNSI